MSSFPLDDFRALFERIPPRAEDVAQPLRTAFARQEGAGGRPGEIAVQIAALTGKRAGVSRPTVALFAGTHGVARHGVSRRRNDATLATVAACGSGDAPVNHLCAANMVGLKVFDLALHLPSGDITTMASMDGKTCAATLAFGMEAIAGGADMILAGAVRSPGDHVASAAVLAALHGGDPAEWIDVDGFTDLERSVDAVQRALADDDTEAPDPVWIAARFGGRELSALAGAIMAARIERLPVILDGMTALAAANVLHAVTPRAVEHCFVGYCSSPAMERAAAAIGLVPLLGKGLTAGEGTSAVLSCNIVRDALTLGMGVMAHPNGYVAGHTH